MDRNYDNRKNFEVSTGKPVAKFCDVTSVNIILSLRFVHPCKQHAVHCWNQ